MVNRTKRMLVVLLTTVLAALVVVIGLLLTDGDLFGGDRPTVTLVSPGGATADAAPSQGSAGAGDAPGSSSASTDPDIPVLSLVEEDDLPVVSLVPGAVAVPVEVSRVAEVMAPGGSLHSGTSPGISVWYDGFAMMSDRGITMAGTTPPGAIGCRDLAPDPLGSPTPVTSLEAYVGHYGCARPDEATVVQVYFDAVDSGDPGFVSVAMTAWRFGG